MMKSYDFIWKVHKYSYNFENISSIFEQIYGIRWKQHFALEIRKWMIWTLLRNSWYLRQIF